ncbi:MAG: DMT family transporter [Clostridiales bacterium]|nr:DMT family transporter [Clostridiales bacterium]
MSHEKRNSVIGIVLLFITAFIWGTSFVAQSDAMDHIGPLTMNGTRSLLAAIFLLPTVFIFDKIKGQKPTLLGVTAKEDKKYSLIAGLMCGILITLASTIQQIGIKDTTVGKAGFLTTLYVVFTPVFALFFGRKVNWNGWVAAGLAVIGMFFICIEKNEPLKLGDLLIIISSIFFGIHMVLVDRYVVRVDAIRLSLMQFLVCSFTCLVGAFIFEEVRLEAILNAAWPIVYAGVFSAGIGYTLQIVAQKWVAPNIAPLIMSLESVFALFAGAILRHEKMRELVYVGCLLVFAGIILAQINFSKKRVKEKEKQQA